MNRRYLRAMILAVLLSAAAIAAGDIYAHFLEQRYIHALAPLIFEQKDLGASLQREAVRQPDLLLLCGSSEVRLTRLFSDYASGFDIFRIGDAGTNNLIYAEDLASVGSDLRGKKVVISFSPDKVWFTEGIRPDFYAGSFSDLHASELAFSTDLSVPLKRDVAKRMLEFPEPLEKDPLLKFALERLADGSPASMALYYAALPLGKLHNLILDLQDDWESVGIIVRRQSRLASTVTHHPAPIDWAALASRAEQETQQNANNNPFGFDNQYWESDGPQLIKLKGTESDQKFIDRIARAKEWADLDLLLRLMKELGAQPMILSTPLPGLYYEYLGISSQARMSYYEKLEAIGKRYGVPVVDFAEQDGEKYFVYDRWSHPSAKGAIYYQQAIDAFFHAGSAAALSSSADLIKQ